MDSRFDAAAPVEPVPVSHVSKGMLALCLAVQLVNGAASSSIGAVASSIGSATSLNAAGMGTAVTTRGASKLLGVLICGGFVSLLGSACWGKATGPPEREAGPTSKQMVVASILTALECLVALSLLGMTRATSGVELYMSMLVQGVAIGGSMQQTTSWVGTAFREDGAGKRFWQTLLAVIFCVGATGAPPMLSWTMSMPHGSPMLGVDLWAALSFLVVLIAVAMMVWLFPQAEREDREYLRHVEMDEQLQAAPPGVEDGVTDGRMSVSGSGRAQMEVACLAMGMMLVIGAEFGASFGMSLLAISRFHVDWSVGAQVPAALWGGVFLGRLMLIPVARVVSSPYHVLLPASMLCLACCASLLVVSSYGALWWSTAAFGLGASAVFPFSLAAVPSRGLTTKGHETALGLMLVAATAGELIFPALVGSLLSSPQPMPGVPSASGASAVTQTGTGALLLMSAACALGAVAQGVAASLQHKSVDSEHEKLLS